MHAPQHHVEIEAPDLSRYAEGTDGLPYVLSFESGRPGPHVLLNALTHGNELCGAIALDRMLRDPPRPRTGRLSFCFANMDAYQRFDPRQPFNNRYVHEDFNRLWSPTVLDGSRDSLELRRARALRPFYDTVDYLLDIHSMQEDTTPLTLCGTAEKGRRLAARTGVPTTIVADAGHDSGVRLRDYGAFADPASPRAALLVECGQHWMASSVRIAEQCCWRFLEAVGTVANAGDPAPAVNGHRLIEVTETITVGSDDFRFDSDFRGMEVIAKAGTRIGLDGDRPVITPYDHCILIMPSRRLRRGQTAVRLGREIATP